MVKSPCAGPSVFDLSVSGRPQGPEEVGGVGKQKTENAGGAGPQGLAGVCVECSHQGTSCEWTSGGARRSAGGDHVRPTAGAFWMIFYQSLS